MLRERRKQGADPIVFERAANINRRHIAREESFFREIRIGARCHRGIFDKRFARFVREDRKNTRLNPRHYCASRMPASARKTKIKHANLILLLYRIKKEKQRTKIHSRMPKHN